MQNSTVCYATILPERYDQWARDDAVSYGLACRTIGRIPSHPARTLVQLEGALQDSQSWIRSHGAHYVEPIGAADTSEPVKQARKLLLQALYETTGTESMELAESARELVGIEGIENIASELADENDLSLAWTLRGALDALRGASESDEMGGIFQAEAQEGFNFVQSGGFRGAWAR